MDVNGHRGNLGWAAWSPATYLDPVEQVLGRGAQIVFGNLEGTLTTATASKCGPGGAAANCYAFRDPPAYVRPHRASSSHRDRPQHVNIERVDLPCRSRNTVSR